MQMTLDELLPKNFPKQTATVEDFRARALALLESEEVSKIHEALYSLKSCDWQEYGNLNIFSLRTSKDCFPTMEEELSEQSSQLWGNTGRRNDNVRKADNKQD